MTVILLIKNQKEKRKKSREMNLNTILKEGVAFHECHINNNTNKKIQKKRYY